MVVGLAIVVIATWLPLYGIYRMRTSFSEKPKIHFIQDMDIQASYRPQEAHLLFSDGRAARSQIPGTVARGHLQLDDHYFQGYRTVDSASGSSIEFFVDLPANVLIDDRLLARGKERYAIFCLLCHDPQGLGNGIIHQRALTAKEAKWVPPTNLMTQELRDRVDGQIFQAISDGARTMPSYNTQIGPADRWAIVAYLRQLQKNSPIAPPAKLVQPSQ
jgi:mono/diheme cytochrome c family protein